jgi:hypothetical protein
MQSGTTGQQALGYLPRSSPTVSKRKKGRLETARGLRVMRLSSSAHYSASGRPVLDQTFSTGRFCGALFGGRHSAASAFLGHREILFYWV